MRLLEHPNVVYLKHCFFSTTEKDELYLNLVLEYVPETVHRVIKHYNKMNQRMPPIYVKLYTYQVWLPCIVYVCLYILIFSLFYFCRRFLTTRLALYRCFFNPSFFIYFSLAKTLLIDLLALPRFLELWLIFMVQSEFATGTSSLKIYWYGCDLYAHYLVYIRMSLCAYISLAIIICLIEQVVNLNVYFFDRSTLILTS